MPVIYHKTENNTIISELTDDDFIISQTQDAIDLLGEISFNNCNRIIFHEKNLHKDFFILKTGLAGDILQKFSNYRVKLAIVGDFEKYPNKSLQDFIRESNKGNTVFFVDNVDSAIKRLQGK